MSDPIDDIEPGYRLQRPDSPDEWEAYHRIRRDVLLEARKYALEDRDEFAPGHYPHLLWFGDRPIGTIRIDIDAAGRAALRLVAIDPQDQSHGHGRALLRLAEEFARAQSCTKTVLYSTPEAVGFYAKAGYLEDDWDDIYLSGVIQMAKPLHTAR